ncbi:MAG TPA: amidohydrolase [Acidimicrobiia bacterium]|nr:amidohydrolase [Acidimicrobiia bacterium]
MTGPDELAGLVEDLTPRVVELRRLLHRNPEPAHHEYRTTEIILRFLSKAGLVLNDRSPRPGGWVDIGDDPRVGFRADIDALPIQEPSENSPRSEIDGWMHACGHDAHAAIAAGLAVAIARTQPDAGVRVLFQPGEESVPGGAIELVDEGLLDGIDSLLAFHVDPTLRVGRVGARVGPITAGAGVMTISIHGPGGHTSRPHKTADLVSAAARVATELPVAIRNSIDARSPLVVAFGSIHGGDAPNVIPTEIVMKGTVRTLDTGLWDVLPALVDKTMSSILALSGAGYRLDYQQGIAPVVNDRRVVTTTTEAIDLAMGKGTVVGTETSMGGEDFSNYLTVTAGALLRLGAASGGGDLHSASFRFNEDAVATGLHAGTAALLSLSAC